VLELLFPVLQIGIADRELPEIAEAEPVESEPEADKDREPQQEIEGAEVPDALILLQHGVEPSEAEEKGGGQHGTQVGEVDAEELDVVAQGKILDDQISHDFYVWLLFNKPDPFKELLGGS